MREWEDYYEILGVSPDASSEEVEQAYRYKVNILHPDRLTGASERIRRQAEEELKRVNRAYGILRDQVRRKEYHSEWLKRKNIPRETNYAQPRPSRSTDMGEKPRSFSIEDLSNIEAKRLLKKSTEKKRNVRKIPVDTMIKSPRSERKSNLSKLRLLYMNY